MTEDIFALDFGTSTIQWARIDLTTGAAPNLNSQDSMPNILRVVNGRLKQIGEDASMAILAHPKEVFDEYKMHLNGDNRVPWEHDVPPERLATLAFQWLVTHESGMKMMGYRPDLPLFVGVPGHWGREDKGRANILACAKAAGVQNVHFIPEPYAATAWVESVANGLGSSPHDGVTLVYDFGGGTLDIALTRYGDGPDDLKHGAHVVGGKDFDRRIAEHFEHQIATISGVTVLSAADHLEIRRKSKILKEKLSELPAARITIFKLEALPGGFDLVMSRDDFFNLCRSEIEQATDTVRYALASNEIEPSRVRRVILTGGSSRLFGLTEKVRKILPHLKTTDILLTASPQLDVVRGLALVGAAFYRDELRSAPRPSLASGWSDREADQLVTTYAVAIGMGLMLNPIPLLDIVGGLAANWKMISDLASRHGRSFGEAEAREMRTELAQCMMGMGFVLVISSLLKLVLIGAFVQAGVGGYVTYITGLAAHQYFKQGATWGTGGAEAVIRRVKGEHPPVETIKRLIRQIREQQNR